MIGAMVLGRQLSRRGIPPFFVVAVQSAIVAAVGTLAIWSGVMPAGSAAAMVAAVVVLILPMSPSSPGPRTRSPASGPWRCRGR